MYTLENKKKKLLNNPAQVICGSFALMIFIGTVLLCLPISSREGTFTPVIDSLFTATSATCVTGLVVYDTYSHWNYFGQGVILALIQLGGLGLVSFATLFNIAIGKKLGLKSMQLASESINSDNTFNAIKLIKMIFTITISIEILGAFILSIVFVPEHGVEGIFMSIFLSISSYCNAGFDILGFQTPFASLTNYADNPIVIYTIIGLIVCGGLGFVVWSDLYNYRKTKKLTLHTKIVLITTAILIITGTLIFLLLEYENSKTIGNMNFIQKVNNSLFQSVTTRTAGFNTIDTNSLTGASKMFSVFLMFIGAAPGSTGGGIKVTTFVVLLMTVISVIKGKNDTIIRGRKIDKSIVYKAFSTVSIASLAIIITTATLSIFSNQSYVSGTNALFESVSAFSTVGLSVGVTGYATEFSKSILILTMFIGRVGPISLGLSLALRKNKVNRNKVIPEAKIIVG